MNCIPPVAGYADIEIEKVLNYLDDSLKGKSYLVGDKLTGADIMISFIVEIVKNNGEFDKYKNIAAYAQQLSTHSAFIKADQIELKAQA